MKKKKINILSIVILIPYIILNILSIWGLIKLIIENGFDEYAIMGLIVCLMYGFLTKLVFDDFILYDRIHEDNEEKEPLSKTSKIIKAVFIMIVAIIFFLEFILPFIIHVK